MLSKNYDFFNSEKKSPLLALLYSKRLEISPKNGRRANDFIGVRDEILKKIKQPKPSIHVKTENVYLKINF